MNIQSRKWLISRRHALRSLGATISLPFLDCMRAAETLAARPKRSVFIYLPNGVNTRDFQIREAGTDYELTEPLKSLEPHRAHITPISGLYHPNGLGHHHNCRKIWLSGGKLGATEKNTISIDQLMAGVTAPHTRFSSLELANKGSSLAVNKDGIALPAINRPGVAFQHLFEEPKGGIEQQRLGLNRKGSILDANLDEARALRKKVGSEDRDRLDQYLTAVRETEIRTERADAWLDIPRPLIDSNAKSRINRDISQDDPGEYFRVMYDLIVLALQTDLTRVATFSTGEEGQGLPIPEIGINQTRHALSHHNGNPELLRQLTQSDAFNMTQFSYFLTRLQETKDGDGTLLDTTMALYGSGMAYGHSHGNANLPLVLAGGSGLGLKHGQHIDFNRESDDFAGYDQHKGIHHRPVNEKAHLSNLLLTLAQKMDVKSESFADSTGIVSEITV